MGLKRDQMTSDTYVKSAYLRDKDQWRYHKPASIYQFHYFQGIDSENASILKMALKESYQRHLEELERLESQFVNQIDILQKQRHEVAERKRSHVHCMVNLVACYKRRR